MQRTTRHGLVYSGGHSRLKYAVRRARDEDRGDLYIVDQHAADEKFRFETLQQPCLISCGLPSVTLISGVRTD